MDYDSMLHDSMEELCGFLTRDAKETVEKIRNAGGRVSSGDVEYIKTLTGALKNTKTALAMLDEYGDGASYDGADGGSMGGGMSGRRGRSRTTGRYVSREGGYSGRRDGSISYDGARTELMEHVNEMMNMASDEPTRAMIRRFKSELEKS